MNVDSKAYYFQTDSSGTPTRGEESGKFLKTGEQMGSYHSVGDKGQNEGEKSISLLPSLGREADGRFDSSVLSRAVTLEQAFLPSWQQLGLGVWKLIGQEFPGSWRMCGLPMRVCRGICVIIRTNESWSADDQEN